MEEVEVTSTIHTNIATSNNLLELVSALEGLDETDFSEQNAESMFDYREKYYGNRIYF